MTRGHSGMRRRTILMVYSLLLLSAGSRADRGEFHDYARVVDVEPIIEDVEHGPEGSDCGGGSTALDAADPPEVFAASIGAGLMLIGFGYLMTFARKYRLAAVSLTMLVTLLLAGRVLESGGRRRAAEAAVTLAATVPATARRIVGDTVEVPA